MDCFDCIVKRTWTRWITGLFYVVDLTTISNNISDKYFVVSLSVSLYFIFITIHDYMQVYAGIEHCKKPTIFILYLGQ
jgi:hypothetical protein